MATTHHIDLGELPPESAPPDPRLQDAGPWPGWQRLAYRLGRSPWWLVLTVAALLLPVPTATGAAPLPGPGVAPHFDLPPGTVYWDRGHVYHLTGYPRSDTVTLTAYRLTDGTVAWRTRLPAGRDVRLHRDGDGLLVSTAADTVGGLPAGEVVTRLDAATGQPVWRRDGAVLDRIEGRLLFRGPVVDQRTFRFDRVVELAVVESATGRVLTQLDGLGWNTRLDPAGRLVTITDRAELRSYDLDSGRLLASVPLPRTPQTNLSLHLHGPSATALVRWADRSEVAVAGFDTATLRQRWRFTRPGGDRPQEIPIPCGELMCLSSGLDRLRAIDPATGTVVWELEQPPAAGGEPLIFTLPAHPRLTDHLLFPAGGELVDTATGTTVLELNGWRVPEDPAAAPDDPVYVLLPRQGPDQDATWIGVLSPDLSQVSPIGSVDGRYGLCAPVGGGYLVCRANLSNTRTAREITVWRLG